MSTLVTGGRGDVALKLRLRWRYSRADSLGFTLELRKILRLMTVCGMRRYYSDAGNLGSIFTKPDKSVFPSYDSVLDHV